ncbi:MAG TPA: amidohydrolase family protein [Candidatus Binatia bacterium]|nr:amidohydrolase family protein [Candidatus Binatia bacterium]
MAQSTVIKGGTVVDGTGRPGVRADVRLADGRIDAIGANLRGDSVIDAAGMVVAPGFIDVHTHYDAQVFWDPALTPSCFHGVTTVVAGNCGFSLAPTRPADHSLLVHTLEKVEDMNPATLTAGIPWDFESFPEYLDSIRRRGCALNFAAYIGHTPLRIWVLGSEASQREATPEEIEQMAALVSEAMNAGAVGFASSFAITHLGADGRPIPSRAAGPEEIEALCRAVATAGKGVVALNGGANLGFAQMYDMAARLGVPITYSALLTTADQRYMKLVEIHRQRRADAPVWPQVSCRPLSFSQTLGDPFILNTNPVFAELSAAAVERRRTAYADPAWRQRVRDAWAAGKGLVPRWETWDVMESTAHPELIGRRVSELGGAPGADELDRLLTLALEEPEPGCLRVRSVVANDDVEGVRLLLNEAGCTLGLSDAGAHIGQLCDAPMPTDLLGNWVRDRKVMSLEEAIRKLTSVQASLFGFEDRGVLKVGAHADVVVFDPHTVAPGPIRRVRDFPANAERLTADQPVGMRDVFVNGCAVVSDGKLDAATVAQRPGHVLAPAPRA